MVIVAKEKFCKSAFKTNVANQTAEEVFKQCFFDYSASLHHYASTIVKNDEEAKDIVQKVFIKLWQKRNEIDFSTSLRSYLFTSVYNLSLNTIRNSKRREQHHYNVHASQITSINPAEEKETRLRIQHAIAALPPRCSEVFIKSRFEAKKYIEIASEMNISIKTVEAQMGRALKHLREQLGDLSLVVLISLYF